MRRLAASLLLALVAQLSLLPTLSACVAAARVAQGAVMSAGCHEAAMPGSHAHPVAMTASSDDTPASHPGAMNHDGECCLGVASCGAAFARVSDADARVLVRTSARVTGELLHAPRTSTLAPEPPPPRAQA